jgi:hypothetical protein
MKVNRQLTALCRRFAAAGLRVTERRDDYARGWRNRNIACDHWRIDFLNAREPRICTIGSNYVTVKGLHDCDVCISIFAGNLELIIE